MGKKKNNYVRCFRAGIGGVNNRNNPEPKEQECMSHLIVSRRKEKENTKSSSQSSAED